MTTLNAVADAPTDVPPNLVDRTRWLAVGSLLGLIVLSLVWELWAAPLRPGGSLLALKALPLVCTAGRAIEKPHVHLPLGEFAGVAVFHRRGGPRLG